MFSKCKYSGGIPGKCRWCRNKMNGRCGTVRVRWEVGEGLRSKGMERAAKWMGV